ncbi:MAG: hypothetical protein BGO30_07125 [Bacteroidetes bacterium 41-46]|nr:MAG: hypothetical protein BGO30_07125 [Bacteroidetes bacterium 41-46]
MKKELVITEKNAKFFYEMASDELKKELENSFGKAFFESDITDSVKSLKDAFKVTGRPETPSFSDVPEDLRPFFQATYNVVVINEALNEGFRGNIYNEDESRYYPWFRPSGSPGSFRFGGASYESSNADAGAGSRLCLKNYDIACYVGKQFTEEYRKMLES